VLWLVLVLVFILLVARLFAGLPDRQAIDSFGGGAQPGQHYYVVPGQR
jgi:hypothetical protein